MPTTLKEIEEEVKTVFHDLQNRVEDLDAEQKRLKEDLTSKTGTMPAEYKTQIDALNTRLNDLMEKVDKALIEAKRPPLGEDANGKKINPARLAFRKAFKKRGDLSLLTHEERALIVPEFMPEEQKALYAADATTGGFFASTDFVMELQEYALLIDNMRKICRIQQTSGEKVQMPALANDASVFTSTEQATFSDSTDPTVSTLNIPVHELRGLLKVSKQNLEDSMFNLETFIKERLMRKFAQKQGQLFLTGTGAGQPRGILSYPSKASSGYAGGSASLNNVTDAIPYVASGAAAGKINPDDVLNVAMDLKEDYDANATYVFTRATLNTIRLFKDTLNQPLWRPFASSDLPATIYNRPYITMPSMDQIASGKLPILVGDFSNYMIVDRIALEFQRLEELLALSGLIAFIARLRVGGDVLLPESFRTLKVN